MSAFELTVLVTVLANVMAEDLSSRQLEFASAVFSQLGETLATIALYRVDQNAGQTKSIEQP